jgi:hypothetical protein
MRAPRQALRCTRPWSRGRHSGEAVAEGGLASLRQQQMRPRGATENALSTAGCFSEADLSLISVALITQPKVLT